MKAILATVLLSVTPAIAIAEPLTGGGTPAAPTIHQILGERYKCGVAAAVKYRRSTGNADEANRQFAKDEAACSAIQDKEMDEISADRATKQPSYSSTPPQHVPTINEVINERARCAIAASAKYFATMRETADSDMANRQKAEDGADCAAAQDAAMDEINAERGRQIIESCRINPKDPRYYCQNVGEPQVPLRAATPASPSCRSIIGNGWDKMPDVADFVRSKPHSERLGLASACNLESLVFAQCWLEPRLSMDEAINLLLKKATNGDKLPETPQCGA